MERKSWQSALLYFILAGMTGVLFRHGMAGGETFGLSLQNVRHAHSHLMFFGWAGLFPFYVMYRLSRPYASDTAKRWMKFGIAGTIILSPVTFMFFLFWGYHPVVIVEASAPLSVIFSSFIMITWYAFAAGYWMSSCKKRSEQSDWFSEALLMLVVSSLGAWGVGALHAAGIEDILLAKAMTHFFLSAFTEGWVVLVILAIVIQRLKLQENDFLIPSDTLKLMIALGAPLTLSYGIPESMITPGLLWSARIGGLMASSAVLIVVFAAFKKCKNDDFVWLWPVLFLTLKAVSQLVVSVYPSQLLLSDHGFRILYLHLLLLGAFTTTAIAFMHQIFRIRVAFYRIVVIACTAVILSLVMPTAIWPAAWKGIWTFNTLTLVAVLPVLSVSLFWYKIHIQSLK